MLPWNEKSAPPVIVSNELREQLDNLSTLPVIDVPIRRKGITSGNRGRCYWNANICSQTWGGEVVLGWMLYGNPYLENNVEITDKNCSLILYGHAIWKTPEGNLVDVTNHGGGKDYFGFLPCLDIEPLLMNGKSAERLPTFFYVHTQQEIEVSFFYASKHFLDWNKSFFGLSKEEREGFFLNAQEDYSKFFGKLISSNAFPFHFVEKVIKTALLQNKVMHLKDKPLLIKLFSTFIREVDETTPKKVVANPTLSLQEVLLTAAKENKPIFECFQHNDLIALDGTDMTWGVASYEVGEVLAGISTCSGKTISQIPPLPSLVKQHKVPTQKKRRRKIAKIAKNHNLSINEVLMLSNPLLTPHPYLVNKAGGAAITRV
tara:strand:+ start:963 stop:2084 length:1122 start_codon:yes stop_codon:yes gene_type:complete